MIRAVVPVCALLWFAACTLSLPALPGGGGGGGDGSGGNGDGAVTGGDGSGGGGDAAVDLRSLACLSTRAADAARNAKMITFDASLSGGAHTWIFNAGEVGKALGSYCGDQGFDGLLVAQLQSLALGDRTLTATGGYQDQKQLGATTAILLAKNTPRVWQRLSASERDKLTLVVRAALVAAAFATSDVNPYIVAGSQQRSLDGSTNTGRDRPGVRNGTVGTVIIASLFLGATEAKSFLSAFDFDAFVGQLESAGLTNLAKTFKTSGEPSGAQIQATVRQPYTYKGLTLDDPTGLMVAMLEGTFTKKIGCGLNGGAGRKDSKGTLGGFIVANCNALPDKGLEGMLNGLDTVDAGGPRSSARAAYEEWHTLTYVQVALLLLDRYKSSGAASAALRLARRGSADLDFKLSTDKSKGQGYRDFRNGSASSSPSTMTDQDYGYHINFDVWRIVEALHKRAGR